MEGILPPKNISTIFTKIMLYATQNSLINVYIMKMLLKLDYSLICYCLKNWGQCILLS